MMPKVSVIMPVFNTAPYLEKCLKSVKEQSLKDIEIICVDDGSTDGSREILEAFAGEDERISILTQENATAGVARNTGLKKATGEYVIFWDSDDCFAPEALEKLYNRAKERDADICICNAQDFDSETGELLYHNYLREPLPQAEVFNINTFSRHFFTFTSPNTWNKLIRSEIFTENGIEFQALRHINDVAGIFLAMAAAKKITLLDENLIYYRVNRTDSLMDTYGDDEEAVYEAYSELKRGLEKGGYFEKKSVRNSYYNKTFVILMYTLRYCNDFETFKKYVDGLKGCWLKELGMDNLPRGMFFSQKRYEQYRFMTDHSAEEFLFYMFCDSNNEAALQRQKRVELRERLQKKQARVTELKDKNTALKEKNAALREKAAEKTLRLKETKAELRETKKQLRKQMRITARQEKELNGRLVRLARRCSRFLSKFRHKK